MTPLFYVRVKDKNSRPQRLRTTLENPKARQLRNKANAGNYRQRSYEHQQRQQSIPNTPSCQPLSKPPSPFMARWRACFFISVLPALLVVVIRKRLPESDIWLQRKKEVGVHVVTRESWSRFFELFSQNYRKWFVLSLILAIFDMTSYWLTFTWMPKYLQQREFTIAQSFLGIIWTQVGILAGCATFGFVTDKLGRRPAYSIYCGPYRGCKSFVFDCPKSLIGK